MSYSPSTASKMPHRYPQSYPQRIVSGKGAYIKDEKGAKYLDCVASLGAITLGHRYEAVDEAVIKTIKDKGTIFSLSNPMEWELADLLSLLIPPGESWRFFHNGADPCQAAVRLARHCTGKETVLSFSYHGASDVFLTASGSPQGTPTGLIGSLVEFDYNAIDTVKDLFEKRSVAAVILEMHTIRWPDKGFLEEIRSLCDHHNALLVADEMVTFPRYLGYSATAFFGVKADLFCVGKGMGNGYAISALGGREKYMKELRDGGVFASTTMGGNLVGVSAAIATLTKIVERAVPAYMRDLGNLLKIKDNPHVKLVGIPCRQFLECSNEVRQKIWQEMIKKGVFMGVPIFFTESMKPSDIKRMSVELDKIIDRLDSIKIEGTPVKEVFRKK